MSIKLSYSAATKYKMSPRAYYLHYQLRLRPDVLSSPLFFGNAMDLALNELLEQKQKGQEVDIDYANQVFKDAWTDAEVDGKKVRLCDPGCIKFSKSDYDASIFNLDDEISIAAGLDPSWVSMRRKGFMMIDAYVDQILPRIQKVHFVQKQIMITNADGDAFTGLIDFCAQWEDGKTYIFDNKTSSIKYAHDAVETSEQLSTYYEAMRDELHIDGAGYVIIPKKMRKQKMPLVPIEVKTGKIDEALIEKTFTMYDEVLQGIKMGEFECNPEVCASVPWGCGYEKYCASQGKDLSGLKYFGKSGK